MASSDDSTIPPTGEEPTSPVWDCEKHTRAISLLDKAEPLATIEEGLKEISEAMESYRQFSHRYRHEVPWAVDVMAQGLVVRIAVLVDTCRRALKKI